MTQSSLVEGVGPTTAAWSEARLLRRFQTLARAVVDASLRVLVGERVSGLDPLGIGSDEIVAGLHRLEPRARSSVWNMQRAVGFDPDDPMPGLTERSRARGLDMALITTRWGLTQHPLLTSVVPHLRVGPVHGPMILIDKACAVLPGSTTRDGQPTAWLVTAPALVRQACTVWDETVSLSRPARDVGAAEPLTARQYTVACRVAQGVKDAAIARELRVSVRTVANEVEVVLRVLGATNRAAAVLAMRGQGPNGRLPAATVR